MLNLYAILAVLPMVAVGKVLKEYNNYYPTYYYDNFRCENGNPGGLTSGTGWSDIVVTAYTACESSDQSVQRKMQDYKSNQMVAIDANLVGGDKAAWCGKKVRIWKGDGTEYMSPGGDLFVWDGCGACSSGPIIDVSAPDYFAITGAAPGGEKAGDPVLKIQVTDEQVVPFGGNPPDAPGGVDTYSGGRPAGAVGEPVCAAPSPPGLAAPAPASADADADAGTEVSASDVEPVVSPPAGSTAAAVDPVAPIATPAAEGAQLNAAASPLVEASTAQMSVGGGDATAAGADAVAASTTATGRRSGHGPGRARPSARNCAKKRINTGH